MNQFGESPLLKYDVAGAIDKKSKKERYAIITKPNNHTERFRPLEKNASPGPLSYDVK